MWWENRYPGCGVDTPSYLYSFPFARCRWSHHFSLRDELLSYLEGVANDFDILPRIRFNCEVISAHYNADRQEWCVLSRAADGTETEDRANFVISAVGAFNKPIIPVV